MEVVRPAFLVAIVSATACTAILGVDHSYQLGDASIDGSDDAVSTDAGGDAPGRASCNDPHTFCDDFETTLGDRWSTYQVAKQGQLLYEATESVSPTHGLLSATPLAYDGGVPPNGLDTDSWMASTRTSVDGGISTITADAMIRIEEIPADTNLVAALFGITIEEFSGGPHWHLRLYQVATGKVRIEEGHYFYTDGGSGFVETDSSKSFVIGQWTPVHMEIALGSTSFGKVWVDGTLVFNRQLTEPWNPKGEALVHAGTFSMWNGSGYWKVLYDDVAMDVK